MSIGFNFLRRYIDQGRNPQLYTKECLERALAKNEQVKGKIDTMTVSQYLNRLSSHLKCADYMKCILVFLDLCKKKLNTVMINVI